MAKLDNPERRKLLPPGKTLIDLGLRKGDILLDIGAGIGYFSIPALEIVGDKGKVIAVDTSDEMIEELTHRAAEAQIKNIAVVKSDEYDFGIEEETIDFALMCHVLHEVDDRKMLLSSAHEILRKDGVIAIIEWRKEETGFGPPLEYRIDSSEAINMLEEVGFHDIRAENQSKYFYTVVGKKDSRNLR